MIKNETTKKEQFINLAKLLDIELRNGITKNTYQNELNVMFDNASIHNTKTVKIWIKKLKWIVFTIPLYSPELNQIKLTFEILKTKYHKETLIA